MRTHTLRRTTAALAVPFLLVGLSACGGDEEPTSGEGGSQSSGEVAEESSMEAGESVDPQEFSERMAASVEKITTAAMTMSMEGGGIEMDAEGTVDYTQDAPAMNMTMSLGPQGTMEMILVDGKMYMSGETMPGDKYLVIDLSDPNGPMGQLGMDGLTDQVDVREQLKQFSEGLTAVTYRGEEDVDGESLQRYAITFDASKVEALGEQAQGTGEVTYDLWLDSEDRMRQMVMEQMGSTMTMTISDYGTDVSIQAPPADQVTEMPDMSQMQ